MTTIFKDAVVFETYGETISAGQPLYKSTGTGSDSGRTAGRLYLLDVSNSDRKVFYGIAKDAGIAADANKRVINAGRAEGFTGLTGGLPVYAGATAGTYTQVPPTSNVQVLGVAQDADTLLVNAALAGSFLSSTGSGSGVGSVDILAAQTFDSAALGDFTQTGLVLSGANPIKGSTSARLIHQPASSQSFKQVIPVDRKFRGRLMQITLQNRSSASEGNLTLLVTDETNAATIMASSPIATEQYQVATAVTASSSATVTGFNNADINKLSVGMSITGAGIPTATVINSINSVAGSIVMSQSATASATITAKISALPARRSFSFTLPANCASFSYTVTALQEAGLPESYVDDVVIELASVALLSTSVSTSTITAWQGYTPTFQGFGTPSAVEFEWRQVGENVEIRGKFTSGTSTGIEARVGLPAGLTSAGTSLIPSISVAGYCGKNADTVLVIPLMEPSVSYITFGQQIATGSGAFTKTNGSSLVVNGSQLGFSVFVPCSGLSATTSTSIPLTQSGLIQEADSMIRLDTANGYGSTATMIRRFSNIRENIGPDILYQDSAVTGSSFTALVSGTYDISFTEVASAVTVCGITKNAPSLSVGITSTAIQFVLASDVISANAYSAGVSWQGYLQAGDVIRPHTNGVSSALNGTITSQFTMSRQGSLKQVTVNPNSKIKIPTSELRFEGASTRGSTATAIVRFDTMAKLRGDAFSIVNDAVNGTVITMLKAGKLDISATITAAAASFLQLTRNQSTLTTLAPVSDQILASSVCEANTRASASWSGFVNIGDVIRVASNGTQSASISNSLNLSFQEQDIQVSVTNILPTFTDVDSSVRVDTANGYGSTATKIRRFSNVRDNIGTDVEYVDSATNGASFTAKTSGIYEISYADNFSAIGYLGVSKNASSLTTDIQNISVSERLFIETAQASGVPSTGAWSGYLSAGDVIRAHTQGGAAGANDRTNFTMSKVGKPNVTGVNVTPFVNVPQPEVESISVLNSPNGFGSSWTLTPRFSSVSTTNKGIIAYTDSATEGAKFTALKRCTVSVSLSGPYLAAGASVVQLYKAQTAVSTGTILAISDFPANSRHVITANVKLEAGEVLSFYYSSASMVRSEYLSINAEALSDQILTAPETFSSDTAALTYGDHVTYPGETALASAPVGTLITYVYTLNSNSLARSTSAPTQTTSDMNANGILIYTRAFNAASTAALPARVAIQIGKGLKGVSLNLFKSAGKVTSGSLDYYGVGAGNEFSEGMRVRDYNEVTGILILDAGQQPVTVTSGATFNFSDTTSQTSGYLVINASKNPALVGMNLNRVAGAVTQTSGQTFTSGTTTKVVWNSSPEFAEGITFDSSNNRFRVLSAGVYDVGALVLSAAVTWSQSNQMQLLLYKNGALVKYLDQDAADTSTITRNMTVGGSCLVKAAANDYFELYLYYERPAGTMSLSTGAGANYFNIAKQGI